MELNTSPFFWKYEEDKQTALEKQRQEYEKQVQQLKIAMTPSTPHPPYHPFDSNMRGGHVGHINGINNGNGVGTAGVYGNTSSTNGYIHKTIPSTPSVMSGLEKWGQDR